MNTVFSREMNFFGYRFSFIIRVPGEGRKKLETRNDKVVKDFKIGGSIKDISQKYGLTSGRISQILMEQGVREPRWNRMTSRQRRLVFKLGHKGLSKSEIGRQVGISRTRVRQILQDGDLEQGQMVEH